MFGVLGSVRPSLSLCPSSVYSWICKKHWNWEHCIFICYQTLMCSCFRARVALQSPGWDATFPCSVGDLHHWHSLPPALPKECFIDTWLSPGVWISHHLFSCDLPLLLIVFSFLWECLITAFGTLSGYGQSCVPHLTSRAELSVSSFLTYRQWLILQRSSKSLPSFHLTPSLPWSCVCPAIPLPWCVFLLSLVDPSSSPSRLLGKFSHRLGKSIPTTRIYQERISPASSRVHFRGCTWGSCTHFVW